MNRRTFLQSTGTLAVSSFAAGAWPMEIAWAADDRMAWWREARFGMFVHWGLYAILGGAWAGRTDYGEWIRNNAKIPIDQYNALIKRFNPHKFDPYQLASLAEDAGMKYLVITTKHHDGFCLWNTKQTDFNVMKTPYGKDIMWMVSEACRRHHVKPCWYHSIMDWHHPDYLPRRDWEKAARPETGASFDRYVKYLHAQVEELLENYGDIGVMWFDGEWESTWTQELGIALAEHCRKLQKKIILNSRVAPHRPSGLDMKDAKQAAKAIGDFGTPEQEIPARGLPGVDWESCITMNKNWGYNRADHAFKSVPQLIGMLTETASKGGNLLLNVGPTAEGLVPAESIDRLQGIARWMRVHGDAIHDTKASPFDSATIRATRKDKRLNCFLSTWPASQDLLLPGVKTLPQGTRLIGDGQRKLPVKLVDAGAVVTLPDQPSDPVCSVLAVDFATAVPDSF